MLILTRRPGEAMLIGPVRVTVVTLPSVEEVTISFYGPLETWFRASELSSEHAVLLGESAQLPRLTRKCDEVVVVSVNGRLLEVTVLEVNDRRNEVKFGILGPIEILVLREELLKPNHSTKPSGGASQ